jgi:hypothetical protein
MLQGGWRQLRVAVRAQQAAKTLRVGAASTHAALKKKCLLFGFTYRAATAASSADRLASSPCRVVSVE